MDSTSDQELMQRFRLLDSSEEIDPLFDDDFNMPKIPDEMSQEDFEAEFDAAHDTLLSHLGRVGTAGEGSAVKGDFSLYRYVDPRRAITIICNKHDPCVLLAILKAQQELPADYVINLDCDPAYISVLPNGDVLGFADDSEGNTILKSFGLLP